MPKFRVRTPAAVLEASRALQAANRARLDARNRDGTTQRSAARVVANALQFAESRISKAAGSQDPWKGAVPEFEPIPPVFARRFGKTLAHATVGLIIKDELNYNYQSQRTYVEYSLSAWSGKRNASILKTYEIPFVTDDRTQVVETIGTPYPAPAGYPESWLLRSYIAEYDTVVLKNTFRNPLFSIPAGKNVSIVVSGFFALSTGTNEKKYFESIQLNDTESPWGHLWGFNTDKNAISYIIEDTNTFTSYPVLITTEPPIAFLCTPTAIKEITVKGTLLEIMEAQYDALEESVSDPTGLSSILDTENYPGGISAFMYGLAGVLSFAKGPITSANVPSHKPTAPDIFRDLYDYCVEKDIAPFAVESELKTFGSARKKLYTDTTGVYPGVTGFYQNGNPLAPLHYMYKADDETVYQATPMLRFKFSPDAPEIPDEDDFSNANFDPDELGGYVLLQDAVTLPAWDWFDHTYCRAMCLALGFTPEDLTIAPPDEP